MIKKIWNYFLTFIIECLLFIPSFFHYPFILKDPAYQSHPKDQKKTQPILLVHGYFYNSSYWRWLRNYLNKNGYVNVFTINLGNPLLSIDEYSEKLKKRIEEINQESHGEDVVLIGHSMGGLVCLNYLCKYGSSDKVHSLITLGTPHFGTYSAYIGFGKCAREMRYQSDFVRKLSCSLKEKENIKIDVIASQSDELIFPIDPSLFVFANSVKIYDRLGHLEMLITPSVFKDILQILEKNKRI